MIFLRDKFPICEFIVLNTFSRPNHQLSIEFNGIFNYMLDKDTKSNDISLYCPKNEVL